MASAPSSMRSRFEDLFAIDSRSLRLFRANLGGLLLVDLAMRARNVRAHYTDDGIFPRVAAIENFRGQVGRWSLHLLGGSVGFEAALFVLAALFAVMLLVGYRTRLAVVVSWVLLVSLQMRMPLILNGSDILLRMLLFWSMFLPWDRDPPGKAVVSVASAALLVQIATLYFVAGYSKINPLWMRGDGLFYALSHFGSPLGQSLLAWPTLLQLTSQAVPWLEVAGALALFSPVWTAEVRLVVVLLFIAFHASIALFMEDLGLFPLTCMVAWAIFLPALAWEAVETSAVGRRPWLARLLPRRGRTPPSTGPVGGEARKGQFASGLAVLLLVYATIGNVDAVERYVRGGRVRLAPRRLQWIANAGLLQQNWRFFATPTRAWSWFIFQMNLEDGRTVDMVSGQEPAFTEASRLAMARALVPDHHWVDYFRAVADPSVPAMGYALDYYCREWNASHSASERAASLTLHWAVQQTYPPTHDVTWRTQVRERACVP